MQESNIEVTIAAPSVALVTLDRPPVNALGLEIREATLRVFDRLEGDAQVRSIVLTAKGHVFCAGADIKEKQALAGAKGDYVRANRLTRDVFFALVDSSKPVIAAVNGAALGAGFVLAACADMIVAADTAVLGMPEIDVGQGGGGAAAYTAAVQGAPHDADR
jgi:enoyl-CoA hydratase